MFGLDPPSIVERVKASGQSPRVPTLGDSVLRGMLGFTLVSLGGFAPWVLAGRWFYRNVGEVGLYATCAILFIGLSGLLLHRLVLGPGSRVRFCQIFSLAFVAYAIAWTMGWMTLRGVRGSIAGALAGIVVMGVILAHGFKAREAMLRIIAVLFLSNVAGYFIGEWAHNAFVVWEQLDVPEVARDRPGLVMLSKAVWGLFYGLGFGAGIGWAFHACQAKARKLILGETR
jgi:hypothetical protein